jgi:hypothetical protein
MPKAEGARAADAMYDLLTLAAQGAKLTLHLEFKYKGASL